ncbi:6-phosphogluconolactonase [Lentilitoribacter sp. EG35]|uniref:6-phosphogluconolactonase n=1 Tax=Lentilitoribacter sp. EG35 TaxID=3234192 RepID=UPI0034604170
MIMNNITNHLYESRPQLAVSLADDIVIRLSDAINKNDHASLAVSGGSTPKLLFQELSTRTLPWDKVTIILVDERYVAPDDPRSNEKLVRENLANNEASTVNILGFWMNGYAIHDAMNMLDAKFKDMNNFDVVILGMGLDGHTASFFPGGSNLTDAINPTCSKAILDMEAEGAGEPRLTITLPQIMKAHYHVLHIEGDEKHEVLQQAMSEDAEQILPIRSVVEAVKLPIHLYWAP